VEQQDEAAFFDAYYRGDHPLPWLAPQAQAEFRRILQMTRSNIMGLVCDATAERLQVEGFRLGADAIEGDKDTWRIWQANNLDSDSDQGILEALITKTAYMLIAPNPTDPSTPFMWVEHPSQAIIAHEPGSNRRVRKAGLKVWEDEWTKELHSSLWVDGFLFKYKTPEPRAGQDVKSLVWLPRIVGKETWPARNPLDVVPLIELPNNPRLLTGGVSELADVTDIQDRINKTVADRLITQDYGAFPQKWATAWPEEDEKGNPLAPIDVGRNRMVTTDVKETKFGQWDAAPLDPYSFAKREDVKDIASRTRTPAQYLLGEMSNVNGETLKASESGLISKVRQRQRTFAEGFEAAVRLARKAAGLSDAGAESLETIWRDPEFRTEGERTDSVVEKFQAHLIPLRQAREDLGYSSTAIDRMEEQDDKAASNDPIINAANKLMGGGAPAAPVMNGGQGAPAGGA
jgi:hypothetical protein